MTEQEKLTKIAENMPKVYEAGKAEGIAEGKQAEYDAFWDGFMNKGTRTSFAYAFAYWEDEIFYPKYDLKPESSAASMFASAQLKNVKQRLKDCGVILDTSKATNLSTAFAYSPTITHIPIIDARNVTGMYAVFYNDRALVEIEKIILSNDGSFVFDSTFFNCVALEEIRFEGVIGKSIGIQYSTKLSKASITSIVNALSTTATGKTATFSKTAVNNAFATSTGAGNGSTSAEWLALVATRSNWTIALA